MNETKNRKIQRFYNRLAHCLDGFTASHGIG